MRNLVLLAAPALVVAPSLALAGPMVQKPGAVPTPPSAYTAPLDRFGHYLDTVGNACRPDQCRVAWLALGLLRAHPGNIVEARRIAGEILRTDRDFPERGSYPYRRAEPPEEVPG